MSQILRGTGETGWGGGGEGGLNIRKCCVSNAADLEHASNGCAINGYDMLCVVSLSQSECAFKARMFYLTG